MPYDTSVEIKGLSDEELKNLSEKEGGYPLGSLDDITSSQWDEAREVLIKFSAENYERLITCRINGEDGPWKVEFFQGGMFYKDYPKITWPRFDDSKLGKTPVQKEVAEFMDFVNQEYWLTDEDVESEVFAVALGDGFETIPFSIAIFKEGKRVVDFFMQVESGEETFSEETFIALKEGGEKLYLEEGEISGEIWGKIKSLSGFRALSEKVSSLKDKRLKEEADEIKKMTAAELEEKRQRQAVVTAASEGFLTNI